MTLEQFFQDHPQGALAFSGGVDSAFLLWAGLRAGADLRPCFVKTPFQPQFELEDSRRLCARLGVALTVIELDVLDDPAVSSNPPDRCYHCKRRLFSHLIDWAAGTELPLVLDGTNASDDAGDRPGMRALEELGVRSPLRECGLTKERIRALSREAGLFTWNKPSYACLATPNSCRPGHHPGGPGAGRDRGSAAVRAGVPGLPPAAESRRMQAPGGARAAPPGSGAAGGHPRCPGPCFF